MKPQPTMTAFSIVLAASLMGLMPESQESQENPEEATETATLIFTGDILLVRGVRTAIEAHGADRLFSETVDSVLRLGTVVSSERLSKA